VIWGLGFEVGVANGVKICPQMTQILRLTIHKVGNRSPKGFHPTIASALADREFVQCWLFGLPIGKRRFGETPPTF
jgi:hypothetical protein